MQSASHELLGDTDPREHGPGWRYVMVPLSARGTKLRTLVDPDSRIARAEPEDAFVVNPDRVGVREEWDAARDRTMSHKPVLIDENHPPEHAGLIVAMPPEHLHLGSVWQPNIGSRQITGHELMAEEHRMGAPVNLNSTFGAGVTIVGVVVPQQPDAAGPVSAWDAEWLEQFAAARGLPVVETAAAETAVADGAGPQVRVGPRGWQAETPAGRTGEDGVYPLSVDGDFRSVETEYAEGLLMYPRDVGKTLEKMSTAGVADEDLRALAAGYERAVDQNETPQVSVRPSEHRHGRENVELSVRDQDWANQSYGRYEQETVVTPDGAVTRRVQADRWGEIAEPTHPERTYEVVQQAKAAHPHLASQLDGLYQQARTPNAIRWAHAQRMGGRIPDGAMQTADRWAGQPIDWPVVQHQAERATARQWTQLAESVSESGTPVTLVTGQGTRHFPAAHSAPDRTDRAK